MTNVDLCNFCEKLHSTLTIKSKNTLYIIKEQGKESAIKELHFTFKNKQDVVIIQQQACNCSAIKNIFNNITNLKSCDFIVLILKNTELKSYFCEIKSSKTKKILEEAIFQIESSKLFFEYLQQNYRLYYKKDFNIRIEESSSIIILPEFSIPQKGSTNAGFQNYKIISVDVDENGVGKISNGYDFFRNE